MTGKIVLLLALFWPCQSESDRPAPFDVVINELMVRPTPSAGLPEAEYIELFNRSQSPVSLKEWSIHVGNRSKKLTDRLLLPGSYLLLTHEKNSHLLSEFGEVEGLPGFPVLAMGGQTVVLKDEKGNVISAVDYSDTWYGSSLKASGGFSLEQIDPFNPCGGKENWTASANYAGGTPNQQNSVYKNNPDNSPPLLVRGSIQPTGSVRLHFNKPMHPLSGWSPKDYLIDDHGEPVSVVPLEPLFYEVDMWFSNAFEKEKDYLLHIQGALYDCAFNYLDKKNARVRIAIPGQPEKNDVLINEVLFNPYPGGVNFVELYNNSHKTIDLKHLVLAGMAEGIPDPAYIISPGGYLLFPGNFVVLTTDPATVKSQYYARDPLPFVTMERMPRMNNQSGSIAVTDLQMNIIDQLEYHEDMHSPVLTDRKGVSLERLNYGRPSADATNWLSASENSGFATPGYQNSQFSEIQGNSDNTLTVDPQIFYPDNSGYYDVVNISYKAGKPGYTGSLTIYNSRGRPVRRLIRNELLGTSGTYSWDGRDDYNGRSRPGIYLIFLEMFHPDGGVHKHKKAVVLGGRYKR